MHPAGRRELVWRGLGQLARRPGKRVEAALLLSPPRPAGAERGAAAGRLGARRARGPSARPGRACGRGWDCAPRRRALVCVRQRAEWSGALGAGGECGRAAPRAARAPGQATGSGLEGLGLRPWGHLAVRAPASPARPLPVPSVERPAEPDEPPGLAAPRGPDRVPRPHSPSPGLGRAAPPTPGRWGFGGAARTSRP